MKRSFARVRLLLLLAVAPGSALGETQTPTREDLMCITLVKHACEQNLPKAVCTSDGKNYSCACGGAPSDTIEMRTTEVFEAGTLCFDTAHAQRDMDIERFINNRNANLIVAPNLKAPPMYYYRLPSGTYCRMLKPALFMGSFQFLISCPEDVDALREQQAQQGTAVPSSSNAAVLAAPVLLSPLAGAQLNYFPRALVLKWSGVPGAVQYRVEIDAFNISTSQWFTLLGKLGFPTQIVVPNTQVQLNFPGKQAGRWRITAVNQNGQLGAPSPWQEFAFLQ